MQNVNLRKVVRALMEVKDEHQNVIRKIEERTDPSTGLVTIIDETREKIRVTIETTKENDAWVL